MACRYNVLCDDHWIPTEEGYKICECLRDRVAKLAFNQSGAPNNYFKLIEDLNDQYIVSGKGEKLTYKGVLSALTNDRKMIEQMYESNMKIVLNGDIGSGKTQFAITLALEMLRNFDLKKEVLTPEERDERYTFYFLSTVRLNSIIFNDDKLEKVIEEASKHKIIIVDDLISESEMVNGKTPYLLEKLNEIVRSVDGIVISTTNYGGDVKEYYENVLDRLKASNGDMLAGKRLANVLSTSTREEHNEFNSLFFTFKTPKHQTRRKKNSPLKDLDI